MKRYWNLYDKICDIENIREAHWCASRWKRFYRSVKNVNENLDVCLNVIQDMLKRWTYRINKWDYRISTINDKGKERELWKLWYYPHRIIQRAIMLQIEHIFMKHFTHFTCASIKWRWGNRVMELMLKYKWKYCLKLDIHHFYQSINHKILKSLLRRKIKDKRLIQLLDLIIDSYPGWKWLPIGSYLSQFLANYYLSFLDHYIVEKLECKQVVRYMDDIVIIDNDKGKLHKLFKYIKKYLNSKLRLDIKKNWQIFPKVRWIDFVWIRYFRWYTLLRNRIKKRMKKKINELNNVVYSTRCSINSYRWWVKNCKGWRLYKKNVIPLSDKMLRFYYYCLKDWKATKKQCDKYYNRFIHFLDFKL